MSTEHNLYQRACQSLPAGVNSPVRAFGAVEGEPLFFEQGSGAHLITSQGEQYLDYVCCWGANCLGHAHPHVTAAVQQRLQLGLGFGTPTELEVEFAEYLLKCLPQFDKVRMVNSGTEATMTAIRLARGITGRDKILKFVGCYHGHSDALLVKAGSGAATFGTPSSQGVPTTTVAHTLLAEFNDIDQVQQLFTQYGDEIAAIIIEPIAGNMNMVLPQENFLSHLRSICDNYQSLLIFDEVMTGFRVSADCAMGLYQVQPDLVTLGKVIGGGLPCAAIVGKSAHMEHLSPLGGVYQAGTLSGNPLAMAAGLATLGFALEKDIYPQLHANTQLLAHSIHELGQKHGIPVNCCAQGGMFGFAFSEQPITCYQDIANSNIQRFKKFFHAMLSHRIHLPPSAFEACFISAAHTQQDCERTLEVIDKVFSNLSE